MKKKVSLLLALVMLFSVLTGCGKDASVDTPDDASGEKGTLTIAYWVEGYQDWWDYVYEETGIKVEYESIPSADYASIMSTRVKGGTAPDLFYNRNQDLAVAYAEAGMVVPFDDEMMAIVNENVSEAGLVPSTSTFVDGSIYGITDAYSFVNVLYYNADLFAENDIEVPTNMDEFIAVCDKFVELGITPFINGASELNHFSHVSFVPQAIWYANNQMDYIKKLSTGEASFTDPEGVKAFQYYQDAVKYMAPDSIGLTHVDAWQVFVDGGAAMLTGESWCIEQNYAVNPTPFQLGVTANPYNYEGEPHLGIGGKSTILLVNANSENKDLAMEYYKFWLTHLREYAKMTGRPAPFKDDGTVYDWAPYADMYAELSKLSGYATQGMPSVVDNDYKTFLQGIIAGTEDVSNLATLQEKLTAALQ